MGWNRVTGTQCSTSCRNGWIHFEYYTKLAHFSVGVDVDANYVIGLGNPGDLGISGNGHQVYILNNHKRHITDQEHKHCASFYFFVT